MLDENYLGKVLKGFQKGIPVQSGYSYLSVVPV